MLRLTWIKNIINEQTASRQKLLILAGLVLLPLSSAFTKQPATQPTQVWIEGRKYDMDTLTATVKDKLRSPSTKDKLRGAELAEMAGHHLAGSRVVRDLHLEAEKTHNVEFKRAAVASLVAINDPHSRSFFFRELKSEDEFIALMSASYLARRMYKEDVDEVVQVLIKDVGIDDQEKAAAQSWSWQAYSVLQKLAEIHKLVLPEPYVADPAERVNRVNAWWQANRPALLAKLRPRPVSKTVPGTQPATQPASSPAN